MYALFGNMTALCLQQIVNNGAYGRFVLRIVGRVAGAMPADGFQRYVKATICAHSASISSVKHNRRPGINAVCA